ncbi:glycogen debranching N-terminal domain-containing protein [Phycicoccus sonneratiae]|uniref:Amylo-alpha-1,6-glucosidase n=1 Tax=Phycicoccus sonneratiae TaxID=2807628 RepID=A0ABS2CIX3_9MICO|nr:glycogen debranching N-terminal domain-containing protein [Phycicoccus sonneraticus]MBM6399803.1 amylo-alpha-1,6-glucosidase [Phycicoccus sonneraticus]
MHPSPPPCQDPQPADERSRQPWLHELEVAVRGPVTSLSLADGDVDAAGPGGEATGVFVDDRRVVHRLAVRLDGRPATGVAASSRAGVTETVGVARHLGSPGPDPTVEVARRRVLVDAGLDEVVTVRNRWDQEVSCRVEVLVAGDGADLHDVKHGVAQPVPSPASASGDTLEWADERHRVRVSAEGAHATAGDDGGVLACDVVVPAAGSVDLVVRVRCERVAATDFDAEAGADLVDLDGVVVTASDSRLDRVVGTSLADLRHLAMRDPLDPADAFAAAGTPWYLTLFGRDSLWAARLALPFGTDLARGTLRALARRQGTVDDVPTAQAPGKIPHEIRRGAFGSAGGMVLPSVYYGTVDATPLWVRLLHDAWRWGMDAVVVHELAPALRGCLAWMERAAAGSPDGLLRYLDESGTGLANQGWKDSGDSMRDATGRIAEGPIALVETQAYAVEAALSAATLLEEVLGEDGGRWRDWAADLSRAVRDRFWVQGEGAPLLAMALDGAGRPVDGLGSNIGHALGTGLLDPAREAVVADALSGPDLLGPLGISTLSRSNPAYNPIGYHTGSVWTHDTAICALGLARAGRGDAASALLRSLVDVASRSDDRWPELYGADPVLGQPVPYPASCRPQAWAAASAGALVEVLLGVRPDAPGGQVRLAPLAPSPFGSVRVEGLRLGGASWSVSLDASGDVVDVVAPDGVEVVVG